MDIILDEFGKAVDFFTAYRLYVIGLDVDLPLSDFLEYSNNCAYWSGYLERDRELKNGRQRRRSKRAVENDLGETEKVPINIVLKPVTRPR